MKPNETKKPNETSREPGRESNPSVGIGCEAVGRAAGRESRDARAHLAEELPGLRPRLRKRRGEHGRARGRAQALARRQPGDRGTQRHVSVRASRTTPSRQSRARPWRGGLRDCDVRCRADDTNPSPNPRARTVRRGEGGCPRRVRDREGKNENRPGIGIQSERADSLNPLRSTRASATARRRVPVCRVPFGLGDKKRWRPDLVALHHRHFETRTTEAERAFPRRASSASRA